MGDGMATLLNTGQVLKLFAKAGITKSRQQLLKWVRAEQVKAERSSNKEGYVFDAAEVRRFILERKPLIPADLMELAEQAGAEQLEQTDNSKDKVKVREKEIRYLKDKIRQLKTEIQERESQDKGRIDEHEYLRLEKELSTITEEMLEYKQQESNDKEKIKDLEGSIIYLEEHIKQLEREIEGLNDRISKDKVMINKLQSEIIGLKKELDQKEKEKEKLKGMKPHVVAPEWEKSVRSKIEGEYKERIHHYERELKYYKEENGQLRKQLRHRPLPFPEESGDISFVQFEHLWNNRVKNRIEKGWHEKRVFWDFVSRFKNQEDILSFDTHRGKFLCPFCEKPFAKLVTMLTHAANEYVEGKDREWQSTWSRHEARVYYRRKSVEELTEQYQKEMAKHIANPEMQVSLSLMPLIWALRMKGVEHSTIPIPMEWIKEEEARRAIQMNWSEDGSMIVTPDMVTEVITKIPYEKERKGELEALYRYLFHDFYDRKKDRYKPNPYKEITFKDFHYEYLGEKIPFGKGQEIPDPYDFLERLRFSHPYNEFKKRFSKGS